MTDTGDGKFSVVSERGERRLARVVLPLPWFGEQNRVGFVFVCSNLSKRKKKKKGMGTCGVTCPKVDPPLGYGDI